MFLPRHAEGEEVHSRGHLTESVLVVLLAILGSLVSFGVTGSQAQFAALNGLFLALAAGVAAFILLSNAGVWNLRNGTTPLALAGIAFLAWAFIASMTSGRFLTALSGEPTGQIGLLALAALALLGAYSAHQHDRSQKVLRWILPPFVLVQGVWALLQPASAVDRGHGGFANSSSLGFALAIALPWLLTLNDASSDRQPERNKKAQEVSGTSPYWHRYSGMAVGLFSLFVAYHIEARSAAVLMVGAILWHYASARIVDARLRQSIWSAALALGALTLSLLAYLERAGRLPFGFLTIRYELWDTALMAVSARPIFGYGADGFFSAGASVTDLQPAFEGVPLIFIDGTTDPHNVFVFVAVSFGLVGLGLALLWFGLWLRRSLVERRVLDRFDPAFMSVLIGVLLLLTMPATLDVLPFFALLFGMSLAPVTPGKDAKRSGIGTHPARIFSDLAPRLLDRRIMFGVSALLWLILIAAMADAAGRVALGPVSYTRSAPFERTNTLRVLGRFDPYFTHQYNASFADLNLQEQPSDDIVTEWRSQRPERVITLDSRHPYYALSYARALWNAGGSAEEVVAAFDEAIDRYPSFPLAHAERALLFARMGDPESARRSLQAVYVFGDPSLYPWGETVRLTEQVLEQRE
jgi:O-antigen ligase